MHQFLLLTIAASGRVKELKALGQQNTAYTIAFLVWFV
jgi:hypothetical protein